MIDSVLATVDFLGAIILSDDLSSCKRRFLIGLLRCAEMRVMNFSEQWEASSCSMLVGNFRTCGRNVCVPWGSIIVRYGLSAFCRRHNRCWVVKRL